jgi:hypothetical protein
MKITLTYIAAIVVLAAIAALAIKSCSDNRGGGASPSFTDRQLDSVRILKKEADRLDSVFKKTIIRQEWEKDSLLSVLNITGTKLDLQTLKTRLAVREAQLARGKAEQDKDFTPYVEKCDSLLPQVDSLTNLVDQARREVLVAKNAYDSILSTNSLNAARLEFDRDFYKQKFDDLSVYTLALEKEKGKLQKKASKRIGIGPSAGVTYYNNKAQPYGGVGITYSLIRL